MCSRVSQERGFTILELVAVVAISSALAIMGLPLLKDFQENHRTAGVPHQFAETLAHARERAVSVGESVYICGSRDGIHCNEDAWAHGWLVYQSAERKLPGAEVPSHEIIEHVTRDSDNFRLRVLDESFASLDDIRFDSRGFNAAEQRLTAVVCRTSGNAEMDAVTVERTGRVRIGKSQLDQQKLSSAKHFDCNQA
jgi:prepilin-type N-terminal cleavage/methylation domain-containing protein